MEILRMRRLVDCKPNQVDGAVVVGVFTARVGDLILEGCNVVERSDGHMVVTLPSFVRASRYGVKSAKFADNDRYRQFRAMALAAYDEAEDQPQDAGLRRVLGAERLEEHHAQ